MINCMQARNTLIHSISHYRIVYACVFLLLISRPTWALTDGTILDIPGSAAPIPTLEGNDTYTDLNYSSDPWYEGPYSRFYAQRTLINGLTYPQQSMSLELTSLGESSAFLTSSANYNEVMIQPQFANHVNVGYVSYYPAPNEGYEYTFRIDSLNRITDVPEPKSLTLILLAIGSLAIARLRRVG